MASSIPAAASGGLTFDVSSVDRACHSAVTWCHRENESLRDEDGGGSGASLLHGLANIAKDGETQVLLTGLLGIRATDNLGT